jgi:hypothetical protein
MLARPPNFSDATQTYGGGPCSDCKAHKAVALLVDVSSDQPISEVHLAVDQMVEQLHVCSFAIPRVVAICDVDRMLACRHAAIGLMWLATGQSAIDAGSIQPAVTAPESPRITVGQVQKHVSVVMRVQDVTFAIVTT